MTVFLQIITLCIAVDSWEVCMPLPPIDCYAPPDGVCEKFADEQSCRFALLFQWMHLSSEPGMRVGHATCIGHRTRVVGK